MSEAQNGGKKMERLTTRDANCADPKVLYGVWVRNHDYISAANRLADYEDTGMTPEEVSTLVKDWSDLCTIVGECGGIDRVRALAEADRAGRLVVLPCKVGGEVYSTLDDLGRLHQCRATYVLLNEKPYLNTVALEPVDYEGSQYGASFGAFGQTVFLTREEAEKALEAMQSE